MSNLLYESSCPFWNPQVEFTSDQRKNLDASTHFKHFSDRMTIDDIISGIIYTAGLTVPPNVIGQCIKVFNDNWVFEWQQLKSFSPEKIKFMNLPLFLETKIVEALSFYRVCALEVEQKKSRENAKIGGLLSATKFSQNQADLVRRSWKIIQSSETEGINIELTKTFYQRFFEVSPVGKSLFERKNTEEQSVTLFKIINYIVENLETVGEMNLFIKRLGGRHAIYGVTEQDFIPFIEEWAKTLQIVFGDEVIDSLTYEAWISVMQFTAKSMIEAGKTKELGQRATCLVEDDKENLVPGYLKITLDRLYLCKDDSYTTYYRQLTLRGMSAITPVTHKDSPHCFQITSRHPSFTLILGGHDEREMKKAIVHFIWRLKALNRVSASGTETYDIDDVASYTNGLNNQIKDAESSSESTTINVRDKSESQVLRTVWSKILEGESSIEMSGTANKFFETLFNRLIMLSPTADKLFNTKTILTHIPALSKMISLITQDRSDILKEKLAKTGGKHFIWGVKDRDFQSFATAVCDALQDTLGDMITLEIRDIWFNTILKLGQDLLKYGKRMNNKNAFSIADLYRKGSRGNSWIESSIIVTLEDIHIYKDKLFKKLRTSVNLSDIVSVQKDNSTKGPTDYVMVIKLGNKKSEYISFEEYRDLKQFYAELKWRIDAVKFSKGKSHQTSLKSINAHDDESISYSNSTTNH
eukprot:TRINITY_DN2523_c0_g1_i1.p1 TRINITY_DN2523_c0_g1~~TRINITY_DN2523_c0_g1_i1.p1  ORF type:complete len:698 (+),score=124.40 TRINITY_DN2523_c0_g1_i1:73-2166(+)